MQTIFIFFIIILNLSNAIYLKDDNDFFLNSNEETRIVQHSDFGDFCKHLNLDNFHNCDYNCSTSKIKGSIVKYCDNILNIETNCYILDSDLILIPQTFHNSDFRAPPVS